MNNFDNADSSFQGLGNLDSTFVLGIVYGCTDSTQCNYNPNATVNDGSCIPCVGGCMDPNASNYNALANVDNGSCIYPGCIDPLATNYNPNANYDDGSCIMPNYGCTITTTTTIGDNSGFAYPVYWNGSNSYNSPCNDVNGPGCFGTQTGTNCCCEPIVVGCMDVTAANYNPLANYSPATGSIFECITTILGCTNSGANNYDPTATVDDGSCTFGVFGCTNPSAINYDPLAVVDDGSCIMNYPGCTDANACNYDINATVDDGSCILPDGCTDPLYLEYDPNALCDNGSCATLIVLGCTDPLACNYDAAANVDDNSCLTDYGCTDNLYIEFDPNATCDDGSCATLIVSGCTDPLANNYDSLANVDDGSCLYSPSCTTASGVTHQIGDFYGGGIIFDLDPVNCGLKIAAVGPYNSGDPAYVTSKYGCMPNNGAPGSGTLIGADNNSYGYFNHDLILNECTSPNIASEVDALTINGYSDWRTPSIGENERIFWDVGPGNSYGLGNSINLDPLNIRYWSNTEEDTDEAYAPSFLPTNWGPSTIEKYKTRRVIPIRYEGLGCIDSTASNYDSTASYSDGSCLYPCLNCGDPGSDQTNPGCCDSTQFNYDPTVTCNNGSCIPFQSACTDPYAMNYNASANADDGSCLYPGCPDPTAQNYGWNDGSGNGNNQNWSGITAGSQSFTNPLYDNTANAITFGYTDGSSFNDGSCIAPILQIGDTYAGGIIFYLDGLGGGLVVSPQPIATSGIQWGCIGVTTGATDTTLGGGLANTNAILANCSTSGIAADVAASHNGGGYNDWFLPSYEEWLEVWQTVGFGGTNQINSTNDSVYWLSTEGSNPDWGYVAKGGNVGCGSQSFWSWEGWDKDMTTADCSGHDIAVHAIRAF